MSKLHLKLADRSGPASVTVFDNNLSVAASMFLAHPHAREASEMIDPGRYTLRVRRPNGAGYDLKVNIDQAGGEATIGESASPYEWLKDIADMGELPEILSPFALAELTGGRVNRFQRKKPREASMCLHWRNSSGRWVQPKLPRITGDLNTDFFRIDVATPLRGVAAIEVRERGRPSLFVLYPGSLGEITLVGQPDLNSLSTSPRVRKSRDKETGLPGIAPPIALRVISASEVFQGLLQLTSSGSPEHADKMAATIKVSDEDESDWRRTSALPTDDDSYKAYNFMQEKFSSPAMAAGAGLFLLRFGEIGLVQDWPRNLSDYFPWLPDGPVIEGWRRLRAPANETDPPYSSWRQDSPPPPGFIGDQPAKPNQPRPDDPLIDAASRFIEAGNRGVPVFAEGLRALDAGLRYCYRALEGHSLRERLRQSIRDVSPFLTHSVDIGPFTAFLGEACDQAGLKPAPEWSNPPQSLFLSFEVGPLGFGVRPHNGWIQGRHEKHFVLSNYPADF